MMTRYYLYLVIFCLFMSGCTLTRHRHDVIQPGKFLLASASKVWRQYHCDQKRLPYLEVIKHQLIPAIIYAGGDVTHQFVYILCSQDQMETLTGTLYRKTYYRGELVNEDLTHNYVLEPGQWEVNAIFTVPEQAPSGNYTYQLVFRYGRKNLINKRLTLKIQ